MTSGAQTARASRTRRARILALGLVAAASLVLSLVPVLGLESVAAQRYSSLEAATSSEPARSVSTIKDTLRVYGIRARAERPFRHDLSAKVDALPWDIFTVKNVVGPGCSAGRLEASYDVCPTGAVGSSRTWVLFGDSHMAMWLGPMAEIAKRRGIELIPLVKQRCMPVDAMLWQPKTDLPYGSCARHHDWAMEQIRRIKPERVVLSGLWVVQLIEPGTTKRAVGARADQLFTRGIHRTMRALRQMSPRPRITVLGPTPIMPRDAGRCVTRAGANYGTCLRDLTRIVKRRQARLYAESRDHGARYLPMIKWFCDGRDTCPVVVGKNIVYRDQDHVTSSYITWLTPMIRNVIF